MQWRALLIFAMLACGLSLVAEAKNSSRPTHTTPVASSAAPGQAGYVHYFLIEHADESLEYQVGIELGDQRIAWSFPDAGVVVSPFVQSGQIEVKGKHYKIKH